jgi:hypothetical protein
LQILRQGFPHISNEINPLWFFQHGLGKFFLTLSTSIHVKHVLSRASRHEAWVAVDDLRSPILLRCMCNRAMVCTRVTRQFHFSHEAG